MNRPRPSRQLTSLFLALLRFAAACWLAGSGVLHPAAVRAQSDSGWSDPTLFFSDKVVSSKNSLTSDGSGSAHLVWVAESDPGAYYYSRWDGAGWTPPVDIIATVDGSDLGVPELVAGTDGKLHLFWAMRTVMYSWAWADDAGSPHSWSAPAPLVVPNGFASGPMGAAQDRLGNWHLVYALGKEGDVYYVFSEDDGLTWSEPVGVSQTGPGLTTFGPKIAVGTNGRLHVVWNEWPAEGDPARENKVYYTQSDDGGVSWSTPRQLGELANSNGNVLAGPDGAVYLAWQAGIYSPNRGRFLQRSTDGGETWDAPIQLSQVNAQSGIPGMALDSVGTLHLITGDGEYVSYDGERTSPPLDLRPLPEEQTENSRLTVVGGNQVLAVVMPFWLPGMYSLSKQLPAPALPTAAAPAPAPAAATPAPAATVVIVTDTPAPETAVVPIAGEWAVEPPESSKTPVLLLSAGITLVLVVVVMIWQLIRRRR